MKRARLPARLIHTRRAPEPAARRQTCPPPRSRFVRFAYRRPPPWAPEAADADAPPPQPLPAEARGWRELVDHALPLRPVRVAQPRATVPTLAHGMQTVLRGDGVYPLEAPWTLPREAGRGRPFYAESLRTIVQPADIDWGAIPAYVPAASDRSLHALACATPDVRFCSSTSSVSPALAALYHLLSNFRATELRGGLSPRVSELPAGFARMHRRPVAVAVSRVGEGDAGPVYAVTSHAAAASGPSILRDLGHSMERMLTTDPAEFVQRYVKGEGDPDRESVGPCGEEEQFYHYSRASSFLLRAQIDCRNAATGHVFDVKTRAVAPIRYDLANYAAFSSHRLRFLHGKSDSYEREFYDMVRSVFLKYALQLRIGRMDGALVAYHNTAELLGLEYIPLREIYSYVFGGEQWADIAFGTSIHLLEEVLREAIATLCTNEAGESLKVVLCTEWSRLKMYVFVQRLAESEQDMFGPEAFLREELEVNSSTVNRTIQPIKNLSADGQWHLDSYLHGRHRGIAMIGTHDGIRALGGKLIGDRPAAIPSPPRRKPVPSLNYAQFNCDWLTKQRFRAWELSVFPLVNDELAPRHMIRLGEGDSFRLKYEMREVETLRKEHLAKFVTSLGRIYAQ